MNLELKPFNDLVLCVGIFTSIALTGCSVKSSEPIVAPVDAQAFSKLTVEDIQNASNPARWQMVWVDDFGIGEITDSRLEAALETFIRDVQITTMDVGGRPVTFSARTEGCWSMAREARRRIITPARTEEKIQEDGSVEYEVIPATLKPYAEIVSVGGACTYHPNIEGKDYDLNWFEPMHDFIDSNFEQAINRIDGNRLEWVDKNGKVLARFEEAAWPKKSFF